MINCLQTVQCVQYGRLQLLYDGGHLFGVGRYHGVCSNVGVWSYGHGVQQVDHLEHAEGDAIN